MCQDCSNRIIKFCKSNNLNNFLSNNSINKIGSIIIIGSDPDFPVHKFYAKKFENELVKQFVVESAEYQDHISNDIDIVLSNSLAEKNRGFLIEVQLDFNIQNQYYSKKDLIKIHFEPNQKLIKCLYYNRVKIGKSISELISLTIKENKD